MLVAWSAILSRYFAIYVLFYCQRNISGLFFLTMKARLSSKFLTVRSSGFVIPPDRVHKGSLEHPVDKRIQRVAHHRLSDLRHLRYIHEKVSIEALHSALSPFQRCWHANYPILSRSVVIFIVVAMSLRVPGSR